MAICPRRKGNGFITGGNDGIINIWAEDLTISKCFNLEDLDIKNLLSHKIRSLAQISDNYIIIGTRSGDLIKYNSSNNKNASRIVRGHFTGRVTGIA